MKLIRYLELPMFMDPFSLSNPKKIREEPGKFSDDTDKYTVVIRGLTQT